MKIQSQNLQKSQMGLIIEVPTEEMQAFLEKAAARLSLKTKIDGFRPGKVPFDMAKKHFGEMAIMEEALQEIIQDTYFKAVKQENLATVGMPKIEVQKLAPGNPLTYKATASLLPKVEIGDLKKIKAEKKEITIDEKKIEETLGTLRRMRAKEAAVNREATLADKVVLDLEMFLDKVPVEGGATKDHAIYLKEKYYIPGLPEKIVGMKKDETKEFVLPFPKEHYNKTMAGKDVEIRVKLKELFEITLPELNDEFAKEIKFDSLDVLKKQLRSNLEIEAKSKESQRVEGEILEQLIKNSQFDDLPELLIDNEIHKMMHELEQGLAQQGQKMDDYLVHIKKKREDLEKDFADQADSRVKSALALRQIAEDQNIDVSDEEVEKQTSNMLEMYKDDKEAQEQIKKQDHKDYLKNNLRTQKVIKWLKEQVLGVSEKDGEK